MFVGVSRRRPPPSSPSLTLAHPLWPISLLLPVSLCLTLPRVQEARCQRRGHHLPNTHKHTSTLMNHHHSSVAGPSSPHAYCFHCKLLITDRHLLRALDQYWSVQLSCVARHLLPVSSPSGSLFSHSLSHANHTLYSVPDTRGHTNTGTKTVSSVHCATVAWVKWAQRSSKSTTCSSVNATTCGTFSCVSLVID